MGGTISLPTYIVLDIPSPMAEKVQELRSRFDSERASLPAEITLTGSCGAGLISMGQSLEDVLELVDRAAAKFNPFKTSFDKVERFSNTDIYFLTFKNPERFLRVHNGFLESGIKFEPSPYPFTPHCTLRLRKPPTEQELLELFFLRTPNEQFTIDTVSVYCLHDMLSCELLHKAELGRRRAS